METFLTHNSDVLRIRRRRVEKIMHENKRKQKAASVVYTVIRPCMSHTSFYMIIYIYASPKSLGDNLQNSILQMYYV